MQTLLHTNREEKERLGIPHGFFYNGWNYVLPMGTCSLLLSVIRLTICGLSEKEALEKISEEAEILGYAPFNFQFPVKFASDEEKSTFFTVLERETRISAVLERTGVGYPKSTRQAVDLLLYAGILQRVVYSNEVMLDVMIEPFPFPQSVLHLTTEEKYVLKHVHRKKPMKFDYLKTNK